MNQLQTFKNELFEVGAKIEGQSILFDVEHVAKCLGFTQLKNGKEYIRWETINKYLSKYLSQLVGKGDLIPEALVYKLAFKASNEAAEKFQDWLAIEVIPSIRKNGGYIALAEDDDESSIMAKALMIANKTIEEKQKRLLKQQKILEAQKPQVLFAQSVSASDSSILVREMAKLLQQNGIEIGEKRLFAWFREKGYLIKKFGTDYNTPTQKSMNMGLFEIKESTINRSNGIQITRTSKITGKGQIYFMNKFLNEVQAQCQ